MRKSVDIDALVGEDTLELTLKGKTYEVKDIPLPLFLEMQSLEEDETDMLILYKQLAKLLDVDVNELKDVGYRAISAALKEVQSWILAAARAGADEMIAAGEELASEPKNP